MNAYFALFFLCLGNVIKLILLPILSGYLESVLNRSDEIFKGIRLVFAVVSRINFLRISSMPLLLIPEHHLRPSNGGFFCILHLLYLVSL